MRMAFYAVAAIMIMAAAILALNWWRHSRGLSPTWGEVNALIAHEFPSVPQITVRSLTVWLHDPNRRQPLLLDIRSPAEYAVSHLHNARWVDTAMPVQQVMAGIPRTEPVVTYCSVGYRSSAYAQRLIKDGFTNVQDLQGSIFQWANDGWPVYRHGRAVREVHPYNGYWGRLLNRSLWAFHPRTAATAP